jgi:hypothetical protein
MDIRAEIKEGVGVVEVHLSGGDISQIDTSRLQAFLRSRMTCESKNHCHVNDNMATKAKCLTNLIEHKYAEPIVEFGATVKPKVIQLSENRFDLVFEINEDEFTGARGRSAGAAPAKSSIIRLEGQAEDLKRFATPERIQRLVQNFAGCHAENHCSLRQGLVERWHCVDTLAQHILRR